MYREQIPSSVPERDSGERVAPLPSRPFPTDALPDPLAAFVREAAAALGCDESMVAAPLLAALGAAVGTTRVLRLKSGWTEPPVFWIVLLAESGAKKSPAIDAGLEPLRRRQDAALREYDEAMAEHRLETERYQRELKRWRSAKDGDDPPEEPETPIATRHVVSDVTVEALAPILKGNPRGLLLARDELSAWFGGFDRYSQARGADEPAWLELHRAGRLTIDRKGGGTIAVPRAAVSVVGGIQPEVIRRLLTIERKHSGFAARMLFVWPPTGVDRWTEAEVPWSVQSEVNRVFDALLSLRHVTGEDDQPRPLELPFSASGKQAWIRFQNGHGEEQADLTGPLRAAGAKLTAYCARFALVIHLAREAAGSESGEPSTLGAEDVEAAIQLIDWFKYQASRVYALVEEGNRERALRQGLELLVRKGGRMTPREWQRSRGLKSVLAAEEEMEALVRVGLAVWEEVAPGQGGGRPTRVLVLLENAGDDSDGTRRNLTQPGPEGVSSGSVRWNPEDHDGFEGDGNELIPRLPPPQDGHLPTEPTRRNLTQPSTTPVSSGSVRCDSADESVPEAAVEAEGSPEKAEWSPGPDTASGPTDDIPF